MINIDKQDRLYRYLLDLGIENPDDQYIELAQNGRYKLDDVRQYLRAKFEPSNTEDIGEEELEKVVDYYADLKKNKSLNKKKLFELLTSYQNTKNNDIKEIIVNSVLKDVLYLCVNYHTRHKDIDLQDLVQVANIGLLDAIEKFKPNAKIDFKDYLVYFVRENITKEFEEDKND